MIVYLGVMKEIEEIKRENIIQNVDTTVGTIGFWLTSNIQAAVRYAIGTEPTYETSTTEFWDDGEPKILQIDQPIIGIIYKLYMAEAILKLYETTDMFMNDRDNYCDYFNGKKTIVTWKDKAILLNKDEANTSFRNTLISQGFDGFLIKNIDDNGTVLYCLFSVDSLHISDIIPVETLDYTR